MAKSDSRVHKQRCALPSWYALFKDITIPSTIIPLDDYFVNYLLADGVQLPVDADGEPIPSYRRPHDSDYDDESDENSNDECNKNTSETQWHFPVIQLKVQEAIREYGAVFPKLDWSAPRDACWMNPTGTMKCTQMADVFLMIKSSDFVMHDLLYAYGEPHNSKEEFRYSDFHASDESSKAKQIFKHSDVHGDRHLILRQWKDIHPAMEFRCFVRSNQLVAISQRDCSTFYPFLPGLEESATKAIVQFFERKLQGKFFDEDNYVFDVYIDADGSSTDAASVARQNILLVDINPYEPGVTDSSLFTWSEIESLTLDAVPVVKILRTEREAMEHQTVAPQFSTNRVPGDMVWLSEGRDFDGFMSDFIEQYRQQLQFDE